MHTKIWRMERNPVDERGWGLESSDSGKALNAWLEVANSRFEMRATKVSPQSLETPPRVITP